MSILSSYLLATPATSFTVATILIEHLLDKMKLMGEFSLERSNLYIKLVCGSISVFPANNERMLKPHLHTLFTRSLNYALRTTTSRFCVRIFTHKLIFTIRFNTLF